MIKLTLIPWEVCGGPKADHVKTAENRGMNMVDIVILGAGTAGTLIANKLAKRPESSEWNITVIDRNNEHVYQPGLLFIPFGMVPAKRVVKSRRKFLPKKANFIESEIELIDKDNHTVKLANGQEIHWDQLIITTGTHPEPELVPGMKDGKEWYKSVFDYYTYEGSTRLKSALEGLKKGRLVVQITEMPIKCPVAPLEFALLAQDYMRKHGRNWDVDVIFVTPLDGAFTKPTASRLLGDLLSKRGIEVVPDFQIEEVDNDTKEIVSYDGRRVPFDLLVTIPPNRGDAVLVKSGLGDDSGFVPINKHTLQSEADPDIWAVGDASNAPTSKAGSVAHFMVESFLPNFLEHLKGEPLTHSFDGHANCFIESGRGEALLLDFNYDYEPVTGLFPEPHVGPLTLLKPSKVNHLSKMAFEPIYWYMLIQGLPLPFPADMPLAGKNFPENVAKGH